MSGASPVSLEREGDIGVITVNYPPVNALGPGVAEGIKECIARGNTDPAIKAMVLIGAGRSFIAGADIRGFGTNRPRLPLGQRVYDVLDASEKPVVAAIHGYALGGGSGNRDGLPLSHRAAQREGRPAGSADRHPAGRRRHAAPAAPDRPEGRARHDRHRPARAGARSREARHHRRGAAGECRSARERRSPGRCASWTRVRCRACATAR